MKMIVETKNDLILKCMALLSINYKPQSMVYQRVEKALQKLNNIELDSLYVMILTSKM